MAREMSESSSDQSVASVPAQDRRPGASTRSNTTMRNRLDRPGTYLGLVIATILLGLSGIWAANKAFAPEMYDRSGPVAMAEAFEKGLNYGTFDLNINIREMRDEHIKRMPKAPEVVILGASHWQEGHVELMPGKDFYNAHVHRDYYEDMLAMTEMFLRHDKMPKQMIIAIRDRLFTPVAARTDFLWLPGIPYYRAMAQRLGMEPHAYWTTAPVQRWRELLSIEMLNTNVRRWYSEPVKPHATPQKHFDTLDTLLPGGSIYWSTEHQKVYTPERSRKLSEEFAAENFPHAPKIDPLGVKKIDRLFAFLKEQGVDVYLVHPPFNPIYFDKIRNSPYRKGLAKIEQLTRDLAAKHDFTVFGSFDPVDIGCTKEMYIDAEHSNPECLGKVFAEFLKVDRSGPGSAKPAAGTHVAALEHGPQQQKKPTVQPVRSASVPGITNQAPPADQSRMARVAAVRPLERGRMSVSPSVDERRRDFQSLVRDIQRVQRQADTLLARVQTALPVSRPQNHPPLPRRNPVVLAIQGKCGAYPAEERLDTTSLTTCVDGGDCRSPANAFASRGLVNATDATSKTTLNGRSN